jgi:hypothetical protein
LVEGQPFLVLDAQANLIAENQMAFLLQMVTTDQRPLGETFIWTKDESPSRLELVESVQEAKQSGESVGPCMVRLIQSGAGKSPYQHITNWSEAA